MLRRCTWELLSCRSVGKRHKLITAQTPFFLSSRNEFTKASQRNSSQGPTPTEETSRPGSYVSKLFLGTALLSAVGGVAAYQTGYIDFNIKNENSSLNSKKIDSVKTLKNLEHPKEDNLPSREQPNSLNTDGKTVKKNAEPHDHKDLEINREVVSEITPQEEQHDDVTVDKNEVESFQQESTVNPDEQTVDSKLSSDDVLSLDNTVPYTNANLEQTETTESLLEQNDGVYSSDNGSQGFNEINSSTNVSEGSGAVGAAPHHVASMEMPKDLLGEEKKAHKSLAHSYSLQPGEEKLDISEGETINVYSAYIKDKEKVKTSKVTTGDTNGKNESDGEKIVLNLIEAIDAAKRKQAELDAIILAEEKRMLKEKYEKELKDARARELMYAEEAAILDKELNKEKVKASAAVKLVREKAEQKLREELQRKEEELSMELQKLQELSKAELNAAIASEKSSQIEKIAEANLNINALCMAFYARSEEARQSHSVHKLALGTLALQDALARGLPISSEVDALRRSLEGIDRDSLLELALSSLPEEALYNGTITQMELNQKFDTLKGSLRHFSLIPAGGGGLLAHAVAHVASSIKMREDQSGDGIESLISKVDGLLVEGKLAEAADSLEAGVRGSEAEEVAVEWVRQVRVRAVAEQTLSLLQAYATSITFEQP